MTKAAPLLCQTVILLYPRFIIELVMLQTKQQSATTNKQNALISLAIVMICTSIHRSRFVAVLVVHRSLSYPTLDGCGGGDETATHMYSYFTSSSSNFQRTACTPGPPIQKGEDEAPLICISEMSQVHIV